MCWRLLLPWDILYICCTWLYLHGIAIVGVAMHDNGIGADLVTLSQQLIPEIHRTCRMWWSWALYSWHLWARWKWNLCLQLWRRVVWYRVRCSRYDSLSLLGILHWLLVRLTIRRDQALKKKNFVLLTAIFIPEINRICRMWRSWGLYSWHLWPRWKWNLCLQLWRRVVWYRVWCSRYDSTANVFTGNFALALGTFDHLKRPCAED